MEVFSRNVTKTDPQKNVYVAGATINSSGNHDIILQKYNSSGTLLWQAIYNGQANMDDLAADLFVDNSLNVFLTGTAVANSTNGNDLVVLKYNSSGQLQWSKFYNNNGLPNPHDAGTSITGDNAGSIFVTGGSFGATTLSDYVTLRINSTTGNIIWTKRYDYAQLNDVASKVKVSGSQIIVTGGSQIMLSPNRWELATIIYNKSNGNVISVQRSSGSATSGTDEIHDIAVDNSGNFYLVGSMVNQNTGHDIAVYKLDSNLNLLWQQTWDGYGNSDKGYGIKLDNSNNVYVAGYTTHSSEGENYAVLKYNSVGNLIWAREFNGIANLNDRAVQLVIDDEGNAFVAGEARNGTHSDFQTIGYSPNGEIFAQASFDGSAGLDDRPSSIAIDLDGNLIVVGQTEIQGGNWKNYTVKYSIFRRPIVISNVGAKHVQNELMIKFHPDLVSQDFVNNKAETYRILSDVIPEQVAINMAIKTGIPFNDKSVTAIKIYNSLSTNDTVSISRQGAEIPVPKFWSILLINVPGNVDLKQVADSLMTMSKDVLMVNRNHVFETTDVPNDSDYGDQLSLNQNNVSINAENAWDVETGDENVKVGVFDTGIQWGHSDFSLDGSNTFQGSVIKGGKDYFTGVEIQNVQFPDDQNHGTPVAGIIGAVRNNLNAIAGIAGGNGDQAGVSLYAMKCNVAIIMLHDAVADALIDGSMSSVYALHLQNHSYRLMLDLDWNDYDFLIDEYEFSWRNGITNVASRGNREPGSPTSVELLPTYPSCLEDSWILSVGASGTDELTPGVGSRKVTGNGDLNDPNDNDYGSYYGLDMDVIAPGTTALVLSLDANDISESIAFSGTSAAAPHVCGVAALLMSQQNSNQEGSPANLAPEDIEFLIQKYATAVTVDDFGGSGLPIPNDYAGYGRVNAESTVNMLEYPIYRVIHSGLPNSVSTSTFPAQSVFLNFYNEFDIPVGIYNATRHEVTHTYSISLPASSTIIDYWPRHSGTWSVDGSTTISAIQEAQFDFELSGSSLNVTVIANAWQLNYEIIDNIPGPTLDNVWIPRTPSEIETAFSFHLFDPLATNLTEPESGKALVLYPNPTFDHLNILVKTYEVGNYKYMILDMHGRQLLKGNMGQPNEGIIQAVIPVDKLAPGMYIVHAASETVSWTKKFIKN